MGYPRKWRKRTRHSSYTAGKGPDTVPKSIVTDTFVTGKHIHFYYERAQFTR